MDVLQRLVESVVSMTLRAVNGIVVIWRSNQPPSADQDYAGWVKPATTQDEYNVNIGTVQTPNWIPMAPMTVIPDFGVIYPTHEKLNGKRVWAVRYDIGSLPNNTTKSVTIPTSVTSIWGPVTERGFDFLNTYAYDTSGNILPLPYVSSYAPGGIFTPGSMNNIVLELNNNIIRVTTQANRSGLNGIVTIKFTRG